MELKKVVTCMCSFVFDKFSSSEETSLASVALEVASVSVTLQVKP